MLDGPSSASPSNDNARFWRLVLALALILITATRLGYLCWFCPLDLAPDEAHYWDWSRHIAWSYYSKGPLVAWLIRLSTELFGPLALSLTGSEMPAVRLPAVLCGSLLLLALYVLTVQTTRSDRLAFLLVVLCTITPLISAASILITIDSPFVTCWAWALVVGHRAIFRNDRWAWGLSGVLVGLGILAKYTMALWIASFGLFLLFTAEFRRYLFQPGFWIMVGAAAICCLPIIWWNATHGWVTFRHVAGQAGVPLDSRPSQFRPFGPFEFLSVQFALLIGWGFVAWLGGMIRFRPGREHDPKIQYLWWMSFPTMLVFGISSLRASGQPNWPVAAYLSGSILGMLWVLEAARSPIAWQRTFIKINAAVACSVCFLITLACHNSRAVWPFMAGVAKQIKSDDLYSIRRVDPTCRLRGFRTLGNEIDKIRHEITGRELTDPILAGLQWNMPGEISFYCDGHPKTYSLGPYAGERYNQYDLWRPNPVADTSMFQGKTFVVINGNEGVLNKLFDHARMAKRVEYTEDDIPVAAWTIWVCDGFRGMDETLMPPRVKY